MSLLLVLLLAQDPQAVPPVRAEEPKSKWMESLHGTLAAKYRARWTGRDSDSDLYEYLTLSWGDPEKDAVSACASLRFSEDLDGQTDTSGYYVFGSRDDTYQHDATSHLYTAYVDMNLGFRLRGGRQTLEGIPEAVPMDGGLAQVDLHERISVAVFGGVPVNLFESSPANDLMYGGWVEATPWSRGRLRLEYLHLEDENVFGAFEDDLLGVSAEQGAGPYRLSGRYTWLEDTSRDVTGRLTAGFARWGFLLEAQATYLFERQQALSYAIDPYSLFLIDLEPYVQASLRASQSLGGGFFVESSATVRELVKKEEEGVYNREFVRWNVTPRADGWPVSGVSFALSGDYWRSTADDFWTVGGDVSWALHPAIEAGAGTSYALYSLDLFTGEERERVRLVYTSLRLRLAEGSFIDARFSFEENDVDRFRMLEVGVRRAF